MKKNSVILVLFLVLFFLGCSNTNSVKEADIYFQKALKYYEKEKYSKSRD